MFQVDKNSVLQRA